MKPSTVLFAIILVLLASTGAATWMFFNDRSAANAFILIFNLLSLANTIVAYIKQTK